MNDNAKDEMRIPAGGETVQGKHGGGSAIALKSYQTEIQRLALERLLTAIFEVDTTLDSLLERLGVTETDRRMLEIRNRGQVTADIIATIRKISSRFDGGERRYHIIERYFGLDGHLPARLSAMAAKYGVSRERIRQLKDRCLDTLRSAKDRNAIETAAIESARRNTRRQQSKLPDYSLALQTLIAPSQEVVGAGTAGDAGTTGDTLDFSVQLQEAKEIHAQKAVNEPSPFVLMDHGELMKLKNIEATFTDEQRIAWKEIAGADSATVSGCAGSGKTTMAMALAVKLSSLGMRTLLTCFNKSTADYMDSVIPECENLTVVSFHALCLRYSRAAEIKVPGGWNHRTWMHALPAALKRVSESHPEQKFDAIIVDEANDMRSNWWQALSSCLVANRLFIFMDDNTVMETESQTQPKTTVNVHLRTNLRTPANLASMASNVYQGSKGEPMRTIRGETQNLEFFRCDSPEEIQQTVGFLIDELVMKEGFKAADIAVLSTRLPQYSSAGKARLKSGSRLVKTLSRVNKHAHIGRAHSFKGLERKVIILVDLDDKYLDEQAGDLGGLLYAVSTRSSERLYVLGSAGAFNTLAMIAAGGPSAQALTGIAPLPKAPVFPGYSQGAGAHTIM